jgi:hypothetical protein
MNQSASQISLTKREFNELLSLPFSYIESYIAYSPRSIKRIKRLGFTYVRKIQQEMRDTSIHTSMSVPLSPQEYMRVY